MKRKSIGYLAALIVAASLLTLVFFQIISEFSTPNHGPLDVLYVWVVLGFWTLVITIIPVAVLIFLTERWNWRSPLLFLGVGAVLGSPTGIWLGWTIMLECIAIGAVAGLTYWWVAGRLTGLRDKALP